MQRSACGCALDVRGDQEESEFLRAGRDAGRPIARGPGVTESMPEKAAPWQRIHATMTAAKQSDNDCGIKLLLLFLKKNRVGGHKATASDSTLRVEMKNLEEQADNTKARELFWKPLSWLGVIRPTSAMMILLLLFLQKQSLV